METIAETSQAIRDLTEYFASINSSIPTRYNKEEYEARIKTISGSILQPKNPQKLPELFIALTNAIQSSQIINKDIVASLLSFTPFKFPSLDHQKFFSLLKLIATKFDMEVQILNHLFSLILTNPHGPSTECISRRIIFTLSSLNRTKGFKAKINIKIKILINQAFKRLEETGDCKMLVWSFVLSFRTRVFPDCFVKEVLEQTIATFNREEIKNRDKLMNFYKELFCMLSSPLIKHNVTDNNNTNNNNSIDEMPNKEYYGFIEPVEYDEIVVTNIIKKKEKFIHSFIKIICRDILTFENGILNEILLIIFSINKENTNNKENINETNKNEYKEDILNRLYKNVFNSSPDQTNIKKEKKCIKTFVNSAKTGTNTTELKKWFKSFAILTQLTTHPSTMLNTICSTTQENILNSCFYFIESLTEKINKTNFKYYEVELIKLKGCVFILLNISLNIENKERLAKWVNEEHINKEFINKQLFTMIETFKKDVGSLENVKKNKERIFIGKNNWKLENILFEIMKKKYI